MSDPERWAQLDLAERPLQQAFERKVLTLEPGEIHPYEAQEWEKALVLLTCGSIELVGSRGSRRRFETGATLWLAELPLRAICNPGSVQAVIVAITRRSDPKNFHPTDEFGRGLASYGVRPFP